MRRPLIDRETLISASVCCECGEPAEFDIWGALASRRGYFCWKHAREIVGCLCDRCVSQTAIDKIEPAS